jgi:hypothetical protein
MGSSSSRAPPPEPCKDHEEILDALFQSASRKELINLCRQEDFEYKRYCANKLFELKEELNDHYNDRCGTNYFLVAIKGEQNVVCLPRKWDVDQNNLIEVVNNEAKKIPIIGIPTQSGQVAPRALRQSQLRDFYLINNHSSRFQFFVEKIKLDLAVKHKMKIQLERMNDDFNRRPVFKVVFENDVPLRVFRKVPQQASRPVPQQVPQQEQDLSDEELP